MKPTHKLAIVITGAALLWMLSGLLFSGKDKDSTDGTQLTEFSNTNNLAKVRTQHLVAQAQRIEVTLRGRTEAKRIVDIKAEMMGRVVATAVERGQRVHKGDILCRLAEDAYSAMLAKADADQKKAEIDYEGALKLKERNLLSSANIAASKAALESARANLKIAQINVEHLTMRAPFAGFVEERPAQVGALMERGGVCARLVDESTILATGQVSEREVISLSEGLAITAQLAGGGFVKGKITFVGRTAHPQTRTFRVEATLQTNGSQLRDGSTTELTIPLNEVMAYQISPAVLALDDAGQMGVRIVNANKMVEFHPVQVVRETSEGVWVTGLPSEINLITVGQEFVADGDKVETTPDAYTSENNQTSLTQAPTQKTSAVP